MSVTHSITGGLVHLSGNPIEVVLTASTPRENHRLAIRVTCKSMIDRILDGSPFTEEIAPLSLVSKFDISGIVDYPAEYGFDYPSVGALNPHGALTLKACLEIGEVWTEVSATGIERKEAWTTPAENALILVNKGKLRPYELALLNEQGKSFASQYIQGGKFLTHQPDFQRVGPNHIPMLWYLSRWTDSHDITMNLKVTTGAGNQFSWSEDHVLWDITGLVEFAFSPGHLYIDVPEGMEDERVESYEFWLTDVDGDISEHRTYLVDYGHHEKSFTFFYVNPLSGVDQLWLTGEHTEGLKTESETVFRQPPFGAKTKVAGVKTITATSHRSWEINTGVKNRDDMLNLRDFLESKELWMVDPDNHTLLIPVFIESGDFTLFDSMEDVQNLNIKILEAHR